MRSFHAKPRHTPPFLDRGRNAGRNSCGRLGDRGPGTRGRAGHFCGVAYIWSFFNARADNRGASATPKKAWRLRLLYKKTPDFSKKNGEVFRKSQKINAILPQIHHAVSPPGASKRHNVFTQQVLGLSQVCPAKTVGVRYHQTLNSNS